MMDHQSELKTELVELIYDLLPEDRAVELRAHIADDPETAALYEQVLHKAVIIAKASRFLPEQSLFDAESPIHNRVKQTVSNSTVTSEPSTASERPAYSEAEEMSPKATEIPLPDVTESGETKVAHAGHHRSQLFRLMPWEFAKRAFQQERSINRIMSCAALCLVAITICGYLYQRYQTMQVTELPLRIVTAVPDRLVKGAPQSLLVQVTDLLGEEQQVPVQVAINTEQGTELAALVEQTDAQGKLLVPLAQLTEQLDIENNTTLQLAVSAGKRPHETYVATLDLIEAPQKRQIENRIGTQRYSVLNSNAETSVRMYAVAQSFPQERLAHFESPQTPAQEQREVIEGSPDQDHLAAFAETGAFPESLSMQSEMMQPSPNRLRDTVGRERTAEEKNITQLARKSFAESGLRRGWDNSIDNDMSQPMTSSDASSFAYEEEASTLASNAADAESDDDLGLSLASRGSGFLKHQTRESPQSKVERDQALASSTVPSSPNSADSARRQSMANTTNDAYYDTHDNAYGRMGLGGGMAGGMSGGAGMGSAMGPGSRAGMGSGEMAKNRGDLHANAFGGTGGGREIADQAGVMQSPDFSLTPEGGQLVTGVQNRVFFRATTAGEPIRELTGYVSDDHGQKTAKLECDIDGYGQFYLEPQQGCQYQLVVDRWATALQQSSNMQPFETAVCLQESPFPVGLGIAKHVVATDEAITVHLRSRRADVPVIVMLSQNEVPLFSQPTVTEKGVKSLQLPLPSAVTGLIEIAAFDAREESPGLIGTEWVLRRPTDWLTVHAEAFAGAQKKTTTTEQNADPYYHVQLRVTDAKGKAVPHAKLSVCTLQGTLPEPLADRFFAAVPSQTALHYLFLHEPLFDNQRNHWEKLDVLLTSDDVESTRELEYLVATADLTAGSIAGKGVGGKAYPMPKLIDNISLLQTGYQQKIIDFQQSQQTRGIVIGLIVVFGGMALGVLSMILVIMRLASGSRMFAVATVAGLSCIFVCMAMLEGQRGGEILALKQSTSASSTDMQVIETPQIAREKRVTAKAEKANSAQHDSPVSVDSEQFRPNATLSEMSESVASEPCAPTLSNPVAPHAVSPFPYDSRRYENHFLTENFANIPIRIMYENDSLQTDAEGKACFDVPTGAISPNAFLSFYLIIDVRGEEGQAGVFRAHFDKILKSGE